MKVTNLGYAIAGKTILNNLCVELRSGQLLFITGPNGAGKSTLLKVLLGQFPRKSGDIRFFVPMDRIGYIPQLANTETHLPLTLRDVLKISVDGLLNLDAIFKLALIENRDLDLRWNTASGGERKRVLLTRALIKDPALLILDEPLNHLDSDSRTRTISALRDFLQSPNGLPKALILVSHDGFSSSELSLFDSRAITIGGG